MQQREEEKDVLFCFVLFCRCVALFLLALLDRFVSMMDDLALYPFSNGNRNEMFDEDEVDENEQIDRPIERPVQPLPSSERGGRRKGVPRRLQLSPEVVKGPPAARLLPVTLPKSVPAAVHHHEQPILTSDQEDEPELEDLYQQNQNYLQLDFLSKELVDDNNNSFVDDNEEILETVDDILADIVTIIVRDVRQQRRKISGQKAPKPVVEPKKKPSPPPVAKHKLSPTVSPVVKRQKTVEPAAALSIQQQQQQLLWEMTQQLMLSAAAANESESLAAVNSSLLKQQLLGLSQSESKASKVRPTSATSPYERGNFAPRRRGRPPKYVTDRTLDLDPSSYDQMFNAMENGMATNAAFQTALASMLGSLPPPAPVQRNGTPASLMKSGAGQTRHSLPATKTSTGGAGGLEMPLMATKKRGPGRPPKTQALFDSHQILQATQRFNSSNANHYPPTMVPASANAFPFNAAFADLLQQQHQH